MEPNRTSGVEPQEPDRNWQDEASERRGSYDGTEDLDGQLGPDELPDPDEVAMNLEAKRHP